MPMECHRVKREMATSGPSWNMTEWPFMPEKVKQQIEADKDKPKATERLYDPVTRRLVVAPGDVLPDNAADLLTEDRVFDPPEQNAAAGAAAARRRVRRK